MKKPRAPRLVTVAVFTTITIVFWVFFTLYNILIGKPDLKIDEKILEPLEPSLDSSSLNQIEGRVYFDENAQITPLIVISGVPNSSNLPEEEIITPIPTTEVPEASGEATLE
ncbi:MAG: hypothetical protein US60_C0015G0032 [Microgenomates group bacterium GW2011_GWC1_37_8]|uniref:Uncharacterized protein n=2 Tax=Candidatus Woeseibacteriota TaxID=1752722 RepID=A0A0G0L4W6_9BACT|nr:MAG: hypothetical protein US60_C0015G0032 [Microgenomates group bacterium GW2011_GWC1_37_8]KKQ86072.1 MAG: hypothetical protein UT08_C0002G0094 [Candidatus Woesebacteria bacterium GW2011_GWB1_38_8]OGM21957.1 MAG: hypothetical protein A2863_02510 [Candidatus Woesebacteria bacterium RIFCSPHIGHO2_01_FULL_38_9b]